MSSAGNSTATVDPAAVAAAAAAAAAQAQAILASINLDATMGAFFIGVVVSASLYGVTCLQTYYYFSQYEKDSMLLKLFVGLIWLLDTLHQALISHAVYIYLVKNFYNLTILNTVVWSVVVEVMINGVMAFLVQGFFVYRIYKLSSRNIWLALPPAAMCVAEFGVISAYVAKAAPVATYTESLNLKSFSLTVNALTVITDVTIALILCYLLQKSRTGFRRSDTLITKLIIFTVNTGLLTSFDAIASLISYVARPNTFIYICFFFALGRLYSNSLLATLNVRRTLSGQSQTSQAFESTSISLQGMNHARSAVSAANMMSHNGKPSNLAIKIDTTKEFSNDHEAGELSVVSQKSMSRGL